MQQPEFPTEFVDKHCSKFIDARCHRRLMGLPPDPDDDREYAECAFRPRGCGMECENCRKFICPIPPTNKADVFYAQVKKYYDDCKAYDEAYALAQINMGAFI